jgi:hypothetical protein
MMCTVLLYMQGWCLASYRYSIPANTSV